jgi:hypothetical protein
MLYVLRTGDWTRGESQNIRPAVIAEVGGFGQAGDVFSLAGDQVGAFRNQAGIPSLLPFKMPARFLIFRRFSLVERLHLRQSLLRLFVASGMVCPYADLEIDVPASPIRRDTPPNVSDTDDGSSTVETIAEAAKKRIASPISIRRRIGKNGHHLQLQRHPNSH